jgi:hypothetical protein
MKLAADRANKAVVAAGGEQRDAVQNRAVVSKVTGGSSRARSECDPPIILTTEQPVATWW